MQLYIILDERHGAQLCADDHLQRFFFGLFSLHIASYRTGHSFCPNSLGAPAPSIGKCDSHLMHIDNGACLYQKVHA